MQSWDLLRQNFLQNVEWNAARALLLEGRLIGGCLARRQYSGIGKVLLSSLEGRQTLATFRRETYPLT